MYVLLLFGFSVAVCKVESVSVVLTRISAHHHRVSGKHPDNVPTGIADGIAMPSCIPSMTAATLLKQTTDLLRRYRRRKGRREA